MLQVTCYISISLVSSQKMSLAKKHTHILEEQQYLRFPALILNQTQLSLQ